MTVTISKSLAAGSVKAPPSKSMAHRYLICGALSEKSVIKGVNFSKDIDATLNCLKALGADVEIDNQAVTIGGLNIQKAITSDTLFCNESGSTLRFLIPICLLLNQKITLTGTERLFSRSLSVYEDICKAQGIDFSLQKNRLTVKGKLKSGKYSVRGDISSQFISGLMFAISQLEDDSVIEITGPIESGSYLGLTIKALSDFGIIISRADERTYLVKGRQSAKNCEIEIEGDYSNAAFLDAFNLFGGNVAVEGLSADSVQGDRVYKELFEKLSSGKPVIDISDCPDLGPILMTVAAVKNGGVFLGTKRLKIKESDRGEAMKAELAKFGCNVEIEENVITVNNCELKSPTQPLYGHNDHRIVMSMAVLASITGGVIIGAEAVSKSFPDFFEKIAEIGIESEVTDTYEIN